MKFYSSVIALVAPVLFISSCVQEDHFGASSEKKIVSFSLQGQVGNTIIIEEQRLIKITVGATEDIKALKPTEILISTFARVEPGPDEVKDFSEAVLYEVYAEDGTSATYTVEVTQEGSEPQLENSSFDSWYTTPKGYKEPGSDANSIWATGNAGTVTLGSANVTPQVISSSNQAAKLVTLDLGNLAGGIGQRMAAGSLFTGKFQLDIANPLNSTKFGIPFSARPKGFSVKYAYSPGSPYLNKNGQILAKNDSCDIYVFLENREGDEIKRVATGWFRSGEEKIDQFYTITVDLIYGTLGTNVPVYQKPVNGLYANPTDKVTHITVVFSSSYNGALFEGGTNSTLVIDQFSLIY
jgi:hypothetical protein